MKFPLFSRLALLLLGLLPLSLSHGTEVYRTAYEVRFTHDREELIGDLLSGPRSDRTTYSTAPYREWYNPANQRRWGSWGPPIRHLPPPRGLGVRDARWQRERVIATGLLDLGYGYQHHHLPDWDPPASWPRHPAVSAPAGKGVDCSNFTTFVYNLALGLMPPSAIGTQAETLRIPGPGPGRHTTAQRIELPESFEDFARVLRPADLLFMNNRQGRVSHVVLWVGDLADTPEGFPLVLDSTGAGHTDSQGRTIPDGVHLRLFKPNIWYFTQASHAIRIIPD